MKRPLVFLSLAATGLTQGTPGRAETKPNRKPNVIFIFADDLGYAELGCYGNTFNETPALDSLARLGVRCPSLAREGITDYIKPDSEIHLDPSHVSLPEALRRNGYHTGIIGKWHLSGYLANGAPAEYRPDE